METGGRLRRNRLILFSVLIGVPAIALVTYAARSMAALSGFGS